MKNVFGVLHCGLALAISIDKPQCPQQVPMYQGVNVAASYVTLMKFVEIMKDPYYLIKF